MNDRADKPSPASEEATAAGRPGERRRATSGRARVSLRAPANPVSRKAVTLWLMEGIFWSIVLVGGSFFLARWIDEGRWSWLPGWALDNIWWLPWLMVLLLVPGALVEPFWRYAVHRWELSEDVVYARSGWLSREWVFVPVSRIQTVDKAQGWFERMLGLATVEIRTASHAGSSTIKGLDYGVAAELAEGLARRAEELRDDAT
ncbi:PH domain-containing protein [Streptosporangium sp. NBC_01755]|uniref:PH domain-containing protein n=1 Tax=unclassified Streptosporangium TaxID=2632669 RepID=UPI002DDC2E46|nr:MULTISPECIES: PH domain-containing protein [unclassified Streptosporangium]WSA27343.1 PH domain-containing protein [Streptosporangium sp. NBC_01810]WSD01084.1 PH domain-containing protein [Streptosporangium sp. NBC_01755]